MPIWSVPDHCLAVALEKRTVTVRPSKNGVRRESRFDRFERVGESVLGLGTENDGFLETAFLEQGGDFLLAEAEADGVVLEAEFHGGE